MYFRDRRHSSRLFSIQAICSNAAFEYKRAILRVESNVPCKGCLAKRRDRPHDVTGLSVVETETARGCSFDGFAFETVVLLLRFTEVL